MSVNYKYLIEERDAAEKLAKQLEAEIEAERAKAVEEIARIQLLLEAEQEKLKALSPARYKSLPLKGSCQYQEQYDALLTWDDGISGQLTSFARELLQVSPDKKVLLKQAAGLIADSASSVDPDLAYRIECLSVSSREAAVLECLRYAGSPSYAASIAIGIFPCLFGERIKRREA